MDESRHRMIAQLIGGRIGNSLLSTGVSLADDAKRESMMRTPDEYRGDAERCERKARQCLSPDARDTFLVSAEVWRDRAATAEREAWRPVIPTPSAAPFDAIGSWSHVVG
jgi:hypothetical protein